MRTRSALALIATGALLVVGCGDDDDDGGASDETTSSTAEDSGPSTVEITAVDYGYEGVPETVPVGTTLSLTNSSDAEMHEIVAVAIPDGVDLSVEELLALPEDELNEVMGGDGPPEMVLVAAPGEASFAAVGDGTLTAPGRYALICGIPTGADPEEFMAAAEGDGDGPPDVGGGPPHFVQGMFAEITVE